MWKGTYKGHLQDEADAAPLTAPSLFANHRPSPFSPLWRPLPMSSSEQQPTMDSPLEYESNASGQVNGTSQLQMVFLPDYREVNLPCWWEAAAFKLFQHSHDFKLIKPAIKFIPLRNPMLAAAILSGRQTPWLNAFWSLLCPEGPRFLTNLQTATAIVATIRQRQPSYVLEWGVTWAFSDLSCYAIAESLYKEIHSAFCSIAFADWIEWCCGYRNEFVSVFFGELAMLRSNIAQLSTQSLISLSKALPSRHPIVDWVLSTAISRDVLCDPSHALRTFVQPIIQLFSDQKSSISSVCQRLTILDARFTRKIICATDWPTSFPVDFSLWEIIGKESPEELAKSTTESARELFIQVSPKNLLTGDGHIKKIATNWSNLCDNLVDCLSTDKDLASYLMKLAEYLIYFGNLHSATAIGFALNASGHRPRSPSPVWDIINPENHFAGYREYVAKNRACLVHMFVYIRELKISKKAPEKLFEFFEMLAGYLEKERMREAGFWQKENLGRAESKSLRKSRIYDRCSFGQSIDSSKPLIHHKNVKSFTIFRNLPHEVQDLIWEESLPGPRIFDTNTFMLLGPQKDKIYSFLTPFTLYVCRSSQISAKSRLRRATLVQFSTGRKRTIYFNPKYDIHRQLFTDLLSQPASYRRECFFKCVEIIPNCHPDVVTAAKNFGLRSLLFSQKFPCLEKLILTSGYTYLGEICVKELSKTKLNRRDCGGIWESVLKCFEERKVSVVTSSTMVAETHSSEVAETVRIVRGQFVDESKVLSEKEIPMDPAFTAGTLIQKAAFSPQDENHTIWEEGLGEASNCRKKFCPGEHLLFSPPSWTWDLADIDLDDSNAISSFAVSGSFSLFSAAAIEMMRGELFTEKIGQTLQTSSGIPRRHLRGVELKYAEFTHSAWNHPETLAAISKVAGVELVPVMDTMISRARVLSNSFRNEHSLGWHRDDYPYACILTLSDTTRVTGGHALLRMGSRVVLACDSQKMGFAYIVQGHCIEHAIAAFHGCLELIIAVTPLRPR